MRKAICGWLLLVICLAGFIAMTGCRNIEKKPAASTTGEFLRQPRVGRAEDASK